MAAPTTISQWLRNLPIVWLTGNAHGVSDANAQGAVYDGQIDLVKQAVEARFPDSTPSDGLAYIGADRALIQGYNESDTTFRARLKAAWDQWALAGTWAELLFQLYFTCGLEGATIVQQNGLAYSLTGNPGPTDDPTTLLQIDELGLNYNVGDLSGVPWWTFDDRTDLCCRFAIILGPGALPPSVMVTARATFNGTTDTVTADWSWKWDGIDYLTMAGPPVTTDGSVPIVAVDSPSNTETTVTVIASAPFTGYVDVVGFLSGSNPFASPTPSTKNLINLVANRWKPAKATLMGTYILVDGNLWGWPRTRKWGDGSKWGASSVFLGP